MKKDIKKGYIEESFDIFSYKNLGKVRVYIDKEQNKWFCLADVCDILELTNPRMVAKRIPEGYVSSTYASINGAISTDGTQSIRQIPMNFVNEAGLYLAIGNSRKPEAKEFMVWVFSEVLPTLNKKGYYIMDNKPKEEVIEELQHKVKSLELEQRRLRNIAYYDKESVLSYADYYGYDVSNKTLLKRLEAKCKYHAEDFNESMKEVSNEVGTIMFLHETVKYVFDKYYDKLKSAIEKGENYYEL